MLAIMFFGILIGQLCSWRILCSDPYHWVMPRYVAAGYAALLFMFSTFTFFPPKVFLFENYFCYEYTAEYGILDDYEPYRMFLDPEERQTDSDSIWYCASKAGGADQMARVSL